MPRFAPSVAAILVLLAQIAIAYAVDRAMDAEDQTSIELMQARQRIKAADYQAAIVLLNLARARTPENPDVHNLLGFATRKLGDLDNAYAHCQTALRLDPAHRGAREYLGELYLQEGKPALAREQLAKLAELCPDGCEERADLEEAIQVHEAATQ